MVKRHFLTEVDTAKQLATCAFCGTKTRIRLRNSTGRWVCKNQDARPSHKAPHHNNNWIATRERLTKEQHNRCAICDKPTTLVLDHCHATGKIRGALCSKCNAGLGLLQDDIRILWSAIEYLKKHKNTEE